MLFAICMPISSYSMAFASFELKWRFSTPADYGRCGSTAWFVRLIRVRGCFARCAQALKGSFLHLQGFDRHLHEPRVHRKPGFYRLQFADFLVDFFDVDCGCDHAWERKRHRVPRFLHEVEPVFR